MDRLVDGGLLEVRYRIRVHGEVGLVSDDSRGRGGSSDGSGDTVFGDVLSNHFFFVHSVDDVLTDAKQEGKHDEVDGVDREWVVVVLIVEALTRD